MVKRLKIKAPAADATVTTTISEAPAHNNTPTPKPASLKIRLGKRTLSASSDEATCSTPPAKKSKVATHSAEKTEHHGQSTTLEDLSRPKRSARKPARFSDATVISAVDSVHKASAPRKILQPDSTNTSESPAPAGAHAVQQDLEAGYDAAFLNHYILPSTDSGTANSNPSDSARLGPESHTNHDPSHNSQKPTSLTTKEVVAHRTKPLAPMNDEQQKLLDIVLAIQALTDCLAFHDQGGSHNYILSCEHELILMQKLLVRDTPTRTSSTWLTALSNCSLLSPNRMRRY